ncbi:50S ribosomal protein L4 [Candidatus Termititenax persephonae]|uniref:Large ribosomal subunit protein uL4 n=1 Tax=Candidatus Termititenax persephonae TaxID=2218525 RepID=A0A388TFH4_9BACT|nr:50S ribosomal protein L4 [Candidatus Termititenax persephonae]
MTAEMKVFDLTAQPVGLITLNEKVFNAKVNKGLVHLAVLSYLAARRAGTHSTLTKSEVRGGGRKPFAQKGTGNARRGSSRSPLIPGGGVAHGPQPRDYAFVMTKSMKKAALRSALTDKKENMIVLKNLDIAQPKTKEMQKVLRSFKLADKALFVDETLPVNAARAGRNIPAIKTENVKNLTVYDLLKHDKFFVTEAAVRKLEEILA